MPEITPAPSPVALDYRRFDFSDGFRRFAIATAPLAGLHPNFASALLDRLLGDHFFRQRVTDWLRRTNLSVSLADDQELVAALLRDVAAGWIRVYDLDQLPLADAVPTPPEPEPVTPPDEPEELDEIVDDERALRITRCDFELGSGPLTFTYLVRDLVGKSVTLRISADSFPGATVHERVLAPNEVADGVHDSEWDGIVTTEGSAQGSKLSAAYSPACVELIHDDVYRDDASFTIPPAKVVIVEVGGLSFDTKREVLLPDTIPLADAEPGAARAPALIALEAVLRFAHDHPGKSVIVAGHTDTVGRQAENQPLSEARARNVHLYLSGDSQGWAAHCRKHYETADQQRVLAWIARSFPDFDCDPGDIDNDFGPLTRAAQNAFRKQYAEQTDEPKSTGDQLSNADWRWFFALYDRALQAALGDSIDLDAERGRLRFADPPFAGFGESFPSDRPDLDSLESERNRRVEIVFLDDDELSLAADATGEALYGEDAEVVREYIPLGFVAEHDAIAFRFIDEFGEPVDALDFTIEDAGGREIQASTDETGQSRLSGLPRGTVRLRLARVDAIDWASDDIAGRELPGAPESVDYVDPEEGVDGPIDEAAFALVFDDDDD